MKISSPALPVLAFLLLGCGEKPDQAAFAATAARSDGAVPGGALEAAEARRLWSGSDFNLYASSPSPDGRYVTEIDWSTGDLAVRDLADGGRLHRLTDKGSWEESGDYAEVSIFSPDGDRVAYGWHVEENDAYQLRILDFSVDEGGVPRGSNPHVVHVGSPLMTYWLYGWTADDEILTGIYRPGNTTALAFLSLSTGDIRILKSFDWRDPRAVLSHDGKHVAYDHPSGENPVERDIYVMSVEEGREDVLVAIPGRDVVLGWLPGDSGLLFYSERSGSPSVWRLPMSDGRAAGPAELVLQEARKMQPLGLVGEELYFGIEVETPSYRTATIDWERARVAATPMTFGDPYGSGGLTRAFTWSADGTHVVHDVSGPNGSWFYLRTAAGGVVGEWRFDLSLIANPAYARWVPGTQAVMVGGIDGRGRGGFFRIDLEAGEFTLERRLEHQGVLERSFSVSSDGRRLYFTGTTDEASEDDGIIEIVELDLVSGRERSVHRVSHLGQVVPSPDGSVVAYHGGGTSAPSTLEIFPVDDGQPMTLHRIDTGNLGGIVGWAPDGEAVLFLVIPSPISRVAELWAASRDGGQATKLGELPDYAGGWSLHPDGRRLAYRSGRRRGEVWALDLGSRPVDADVSGGMRP